MARLQENWYDTVDSLRTIDDTTYEKLKVPARLVELIKKKLSQTPVRQKNETPVQTLPSKPSNQNKDNEMMIEFEEKKQPERGGVVPIEEIIKQKAQKGKNSKSEWAKLLERIKKEVGFGEKLETTLILLEKISSNIIKEPAREQFRTLKVESNQKIREAIGIYPSAVEALILVDLLLKLDLIGSFIIVGIRACRGRSSYHEREKHEH